MRSPDELESVVKQGKRLKKPKELILRFSIGRPKRELVPFQLLQLHEMGCKKQKGTNFNHILRGNLKFEISKKNMIK